MESNKYYSSEFTPLTGALKLYLLFSELPDNSKLELYKIFSIYPLLDNKKFLDYLLERKRTHDFYKLISDFIAIEKNDFFINYSIKYDICKRQCFESIYFALISDILRIKDGKLVKGRILPSIVISDFQMVNQGIIKLGKTIKAVSYIDLLQILKVGEKNGKN